MFQGRNLLPVILVEENLLALMRKKDMPKFIQSQNPRKLPQHQLQETVQTDNIKSQVGVKKAILELQKA